MDRGASGGGQRVRTGAAAGGIAPASERKQSFRSLFPDRRFNGEKTAPPVSSSSIPSVAAASLEVGSLLGGSLPALSPAERARWFEEEVRPHERSLRAYLRVRFSTLLDLDDLVQETYAKVMRVRESGPVASPKSLLFTIARNAAFSLLRRQQAVAMESTGDMERFSLVAESPDAAEIASQAQEIELLQEALRELPDRCRQILTLRMTYGLKHREIAEQLGIAERTVNNQMGLGLERCRRFFLARGVKIASQP